MTGKGASASNVPKVPWGLCAPAQGCTESQQDQRPWGLPDEHRGSKLCFACDSSQSFMLSWAVVVVVGNDKVDFVREKTHQPHFMGRI